MAIITITGHDDIELLGTLSSAITVTCPATTFNGAYTLSSASAGADTLITSADVGDFNGLTSAAAVNKYIYVSAGTGMVGLHKITAIAVDTTGLTIQIDTPYNAANAITTIALAGSDVPIYSLTIPALRVNSVIEIQTLWENTGSTNSKQYIAKLGTDEFLNVANTTAANIAINRPVSIINENSLSAQVGRMPKGVATPLSGYFTAALPTGTTDTSVPSTLTLSAIMAVANEFVTLRSARVVAIW